MSTLKHRILVLTIGFAGISNSMLGNSFAEKLINNWKTSTTLLMENTLAGSSCLLFPPPVVASVSVRVNNGSDDAEESTSSGAVNLTSTDLELVADGSSAQVVGLRFNGITISQGATINSAYIEFECDEATSNSTSVTIRGQDSDNASTFTTGANNISNTTSRPRTTAQVSWNNLSAWSVNNKYQTEDIAGIVQEIVNRGGWSSGNSMAFFIEGSGRRTAESYDGETAAAPLLVIDYTDGSSSGCNTVIDSEDFESGWGIWNDGGSDSNLSTANTNSGTYSINLQDNSSSSVMTTDNLDLTVYQEIEVSFTYYAVSMDNANEDFWLQLSTDGGSNFTTVEEWNEGDEFVNNVRYFETVSISGPFTTNTQLRFRCDASGNADDVYIDDVEIVGCTTPEICGNGIDDDGDTLVDCNDPDCGAPAISSVSPTNATNCPDQNNGQISISSSGSNLEYSIDNGATFQPSNSFSNLTAGSYNIQVRNSISGCSENYVSNPVVISAGSCGEICDNGIDDDSDGLIDCEDSDCSFSTSNVASTDVPKSISASAVSTVTSTLVVSNPGIISDINIENLDITHSYIDDVIVRLTSPSGTTVTVLSQPCNGEDNILMDLDDEASPGSLPCPPTTGLSYQPANALSAFDGEDMNGTWTLSVEDVYGPADGGSLSGWGLDIEYGCPTEICDNGIDDDGDGLVDCADPDCNFLTNHEFDSGTSDWALYQQSGSSATLSIDNTSQLSGINSAFVDISTASGTDWHLQLAQIYQSIEAGKDYTVSFWARAATNRTVFVHAQLRASPWTDYWSQTINLSTSPNFYSYTFTASTTVSNNVGLLFDLAASTGDVWIDDVYFGEVCSNNAFSCPGSLLINPDFEAGTGSWNLSANASLTSDAYYGSQAVYAGSGAGGIGQNYAASAGEIYTLSVYAKQSAPEGAYIGLKFLNSGLVEIGYSHYVDITSSTYEEYVMSAMAPAGTAYVQALGWKNSGTGNATFDGFCMEAWGLTSPTCSGNSCEITPDWANYLWSIDDSGVDANWKDYDTGGLILCDNGDGTLSIKGNVINGRDADWGPGDNPACGTQDGWIIDFTLSDMQAWSQFGGNYEIDAACPNAYQILDYWDVTGTVTGLGCNAGRVVTFGPSAGYRLQIGSGGNSHTCDFGLSTWFTGDESGNNIKGDIYAHIDSACYYSMRPVEICNNSTDDDGDGLIDCADPDCESPSVAAVTPINATNCPGQNNGQISISATGSNLEYSIDNGANYQASNSFTGLSAGNYNIRVRNAVSGCSHDYASNPVVLAAISCTSEVCNNGIDDDGDGLVDCNDPDCNSITNGEFDSGTSDWSFYQQSGASATFTIDNSSQLSGTNSAYVNITSTNGNEWDVQLAQLGKSIVAGTTYIISFEARATSNRTIHVQAQERAAPWTSYWGQNISLTSVASSFIYSFTAGASSNNVGLMFDLGTSTTNLWIDNVRFTEECPASPELCGNGLDDDGDGLIDSADPDCPAKFACDSRFYQTIEVSGDYWLYELETDPVGLTPLVNLTASASLTDDINGAVFNKNDGYIYFIELHAPYRLYRIGSDYSIIYLGNVSGFPSGFYPNAADMGGNGNMYYRGAFGSDIYELNLNNLTATLVCDYPSWPEQTNNIGDLAYNPINGYFYGTRDSTSSLLAFDFGACDSTLINLSQWIDGALGAFYIAADGTGYGYANNTGHLYEINLSSGLVEVIGNGPATAQTDGCSCEGLKFTKEVSPGTVTAGNSTTYTFTIYNNWYAPLTNVYFRDTLTQGLLWDSEPYNLGGGITFGTTSISGSANGVFTITNLPIGTTTFQIDASTPVGYAGPVPHYNQAYLENLPALLAPFRPSDYPTTPQIDDPTPLVIQPAVEICYNSVDDDGDGQVDCNDLDCNCDGGTDYGDAPASYGEICYTIKADGDPYSPTRFGVLVDGENSMPHSNNADGDGSDEDGFTFSNNGNWSVGSTQDITLSWTTNDNNGHVFGWIDWDGNGTFDNDELVITSFLVGENDGTSDNYGGLRQKSGNKTISITVPNDAVCGSTYARFTIQSDSNQEGPTGTFCSTDTNFIQDGEVEDYMINLSGCGEICNNGIDDDGNGLIDCFDTQCQPIINSITPANPANCPGLNDGQISIAFSGSNLEFSINGGFTYQSSNVFSGLTEGSYNIRARNTVTGCFADYHGNPVVLTDSDCSEICNNGIDDNGNGLIDSDDPYCPCTSRVTGGLLALYEFNAGTGSTVNDISGVGTAVDLTVETPANTAWSADCGLDVVTATRLTSSGAATKISNGIMASNALTIEAWIKPDNTSFNTETRLVTLSNGGNNRNFTLSQWYDHYAVRVRTTDTDNNGGSWQVTGSDVAFDNYIQHVIYTWDGTTGEEKIIVDGQEKYSGTRTGNTSNWDNTYQLAVANEIGTSRDWLGELYLVAIYDKVLSDVEIAQNLGVGPCCGSYGNPEIDCSDNRDLEIVYEGIQNNVPVTLNITDIGTIDSIVVEIAYDNNNPGASIIIQDALGNSYTANRFDVGPVRLYRTALPATTSITYSNQTNENEAQSIVAYVYRSTSGGKTILTNLTDVGGYQSTEYINFNLPASPNPRNITVKLPVTELSYDDRILNFTATAGNVTTTLTKQWGPSGDGFPNGCCVDLVELTLLNVTSSVLNIAIESPSGSPGGQSIAVGGTTAIDIYCGDPEICDNGIDDDGDGFADCADSDCGLISLANVTVGTCIEHPLQDVTTLDVDVIWSGAPANDTIEVSISGKTAYIPTDLLVSPQTVTFNIPADGSVNNSITASWRSGTVSCSASETYNAPSSCSSASIVCNILYLCGDEKESDSDPWDHGWIEYIDQQNGGAILTPVLTKPDVSGLGMYDPANESVPMVINFDDYEMIIISASTEDHISDDLVDTLKDLNHSILLGNYKLINDFGMSTTEGFYQTQDHAYTDNTTQRTIYNFNNVNPSRNHVLTKGDYTTGATAQLWANAGDQAAGTDGNFFFFEETDPLTGIDNKHGRRIYLGYHMNGVYANSENGGALPVPATSWFDPVKHLTLDGKYYFDLALVEAAASCGGAEICNNELDDDGDGLVDCNDPDCNPLPAGAVSATYRTIADGSWTDGAIWQGGSAPPTGNVDATSISIEHNVIVPTGEIELRNGSSLWVYNGSLTLNGGDFKINRSTAIFENASLITALGYGVDLNDTGSGGTKARLHMTNCSVDIGKDFDNSDGHRKMENVCLTVSERFLNSEKDTLINVCGTIGTNYTPSGGWGGHSESFDVSWFAQTYIKDSEFNLINGDFENSTLCLVDGSNLKLWVQNGEVDNNGFWTCAVAQYCVSDDVSIPNSYLPLTEECSTIDWYFTNCDCGCTPVPELCVGGIDEDGDGLFDCDDPDCGGIANAGEDVNSCAGENVTLTATATGTTGPYTFAWSNGLGNTASVIASPTTTTTYTVTISNAGGCTATDEVTINIGACPENCFNGIDDDGDGLIDCDDPDCNNLNLNGTIISPICEGGSDGAIDLEVTGGKLPYAYNWSNGATSQDISGISTGLYQVTVTDDYGCTATDSYSVPDGYTLQLVSEVTNSNCYGDASGAINLTVVGGTEPYSYAWSNGATTEDISGLGFGAYGVTVSDANSCTQVGFYTVLQALSSAYEYYYIPIPETNIHSSFQGFTDYVGYSISNSMRTIISMVNTEDGNLIYYDHWEDGYEADIFNPTQSTTQVWGDNNSANGTPPGLGSDNLQDGDVIGIDNTVPLPRNPSQIYYDGRDKIASAHQLALSRAAWAPTPGPVLSGAVDIMDINAFARDYEIPIGEDISSSQMFEYVSLLVMAQEDNTIVWIDTDGNGSPNLTRWLDEGETYQMDGGVQSGARVTSSKPVQAHLITGDFGGLYENRWFTLIPTEKWDNSYFAPVGTTISSDPADVFIYNPNNSSITVHYNTKSGSGSFNVGSENVYRFRMPMHSGAHFYTNSENDEFYAVSTIDSDDSDHDAHDWGYNLLPESYLTISASIGWGPGNSDLSGNGSPAWVIASQPTRLYVDYDGDPSTGTLTDPAGKRYDAHYDLTAFESKRVFDNNDNDQTGMYLYTLDGTLISAAWGQDPETADPGNPYLDFGTTVPPIRKIEGFKEYEHTVDVNGDGLVDPGDEITFYLNLVNSGNSPVLGVTVFDPLPAEVTYIPNTTYFNSSLVPDNSSGTAFPVDEVGYYISQIPINTAYVISFRTTVNNMPPYFSEIVNSFSTLVEVPCKTINSEVVIPVVIPPVATNCTLSFTDVGGGSVSTYDQNSQVCVSVEDNDRNTNNTSPQTIVVTVQNNTHGDSESVTLTETGNDTGIFRGCITSSTSNGQSNNNGILFALGGHSLSASFSDTYNGDNCSDNVIVLTTSYTKQLYLSEDGTGAPDQDLDRNDPLATGDVTTAITANLSSGDSEVFSQVPVMCTDFNLPAGGLIGATIYVGIVSGSMPANPNITAVVRYGATNVATLTNPTYSGGVLTFTGAMSSNVTVPAGATVELEISSNQSGVTFHIEYDSQTDPSRIDLPTTTVITIDELNVYSNTYPAGVVLPALTTNETVYIRSTVSDPFGYYDINDLEMNISYPGGSLTNVSMPVVNSEGCSSTFEYEWTVPTAVPGDVNISVVAFEGFENTVFDTVQAIIPVDTVPPIIPCALTLVDDSGSPTSALLTDNQVCIQLDDINENQDDYAAEVVFVQVTANNGDTENVILSETGNATGVFLGCIDSDQEVGGNDDDGILYMVGGNVVTASFDQSSGEGACSDDATVILQTDTKPLYLTSVGQSLDRIDPVATNDVTTATVTIGTPPQTTCFVSDGFDSLAYSNNDGSANWANDWQELGESDGVSSGRIRIASNSLRIGGYSDDGMSITGRGIWREVDLSGSSGAAMGIDFTENYTSSSFSVTLAVSSNGGSTYTDLETFTFSTGTVSRYYDLTPYISSNTRIRLLANGYLPEEITRQMFFDNLYIKFVCSGSGPGSGGLNPIQDASITSARPDNNFGGQTTFGVNSVYHSLIQFNTSDIPSTAVVNSAQLVLNRAGGTLSPTGSVEVRALTQSWSEGSQQDVACTNGVTWNDRDCNPTSSWSNTGGTINGTVYATSTMLAGTNTWDVTSLVQAWVDGSVSNNGMLLQVTAGSETHTFNSRESSNPPQLIIDYTDSGGSGGSGGGSTPAPGSDMAIWSASAAPEYSEWDGSAFGTTQSGVTQSIRWRIMQGASSPTRDEKIVIGVETGGEISGELWNGSTWDKTDMTSLAYVNQTYWWGCEVAYESQSGDALLVWSGGNTYSNQLRYQIWDGSSWSSPANIAAYTGTTPYQIKLAASPNSDEMVVVVNDASEADWALVWDGSSWGDQIQLATATTDDRTDINVAYEQQSGNAMVTYGNGDGNVRYQIWDGSSWSGESSLAPPAGPSGYTRWTTLASDRNSDRILLGVQSSDPDGWVAIWDGTSWGDQELLTASSLVLDIGTAPNLAVAFEQNSGDAVVAYGRSNQNVFFYRTHSSGSGWSSEQIGTNVGNNTNSIGLFADPTSDEMMLIVQDNNQDLNVFPWDGTTWGSNFILEYLSGEEKNQPFTFLWSGVSSSGGGGTSAEASSIWLATETAVTAGGAPGIETWGNGEVLQFADPDLSFSPSTNGTLSSVFDLSSFAQDADARINGLHYVQTDLQVGSNNVQLEAGDLLLTTVFPETFNNSDLSTTAVEAHHIVLFEPDAPGNYTAGSFTILVDYSDIQGNYAVHGFTLVEEPVTVGTTTSTSLSAGEFLVVRDGATDVINRYIPGNLGTTSSGTASTLVDGSDLGIGSSNPIRGLDIIESGLNLGGTNLTAGQILVTLHLDDLSVGGISTSREDIFILDVTATGSTSSGTASTFFQGADVNLDTWKEQPYAFTLAPAVNGPSGCTSTSFTALEDAMLYELNGTYNYSGTNNFQVGAFSSSGTQDIHSVIKFDVSSLSGETINSAVLNVELRSTSGVPVVIEAHRVTTDWSEANVSWSAPWATAGGDFSSSTEGSATVTSAIALGDPTETMTIDITSLVQDWADGTYPNYGLILVDPSGQDRSINAHASEGSVPPTIVVNSCPGGSGGSGATNSDATFIQSIPMCTDLIMPAGGIVQVTNYVNVISGSFPANPDITAVLKHGSTTFATMTSPTYNSGTGTMVWNQILSTNYTLPAGDAVSLEITQNDSGYSFNIEYDSETKPSKIDLPTQTIIAIEELAVYDSSYTEGNIIIDAENGETVYIRTTVSDPFGPEDVTSLDLTITAPSGTVLVDTTLYDGSVAGTAGCNKIYEYEWVTGVEQGIYDIDVVAHEGYEGIQDEASTQIEIQFNDLGSPCQVQFSDGTDEVTTYDPNDLICIRVTDIDENENPLMAETLTATVSSSSGDSEDLTLIEIGVNTGEFLFCISSNSLTVGSVNDGVLYAQMGDLLTLEYTDADISADECSTTALINSVNPEVDIAIELVEPDDGVAVVGEHIQFNITVSNPGPTPLTYLLLNNTFNATELTYTGSSFAPNIINTGSLLWNVPVTIESGESYVIEVYYTGAAPANPAISTASVSGNDQNNTPVTAGPVNDDVIITRPLVAVDKYLIDPPAGPHIIGDTLTYQIDITNTGTTNITSLPLSDDFSASCLEFVDASPADDGSGAGTAVWNNLGPLASSASISVSTRFVITDICSPIENIALITLAIDENGDPVPPVSDTVAILVDSPPIAVDDTDSTGVGIPVTVDVVSNDFDYNGNLDTSSVTTVGVLQPAHGTVTGIDPTTGEMTYQPNGGFAGEDSFEYIICDLTSLCDTALVTIIIVNEDCTNGVDDDGDGLIDCDDPDCTNFNDGGWLGGNEEECGAYDPSEIISLTLPSGGVGGSYNYYWEYSVNGGLSWTTVPGANGETYDPPTITQTYWFRRAARRFECTSWVFSNYAVKSVSDCPEICDNGLDDDGDGLFDCDDDDCIPTVVASGNISICIADSTTISVAASDGTPPYEFIWDNGLGIGESHVVSPDTTTTYRVMVLTASGCFAVDSVVVSVVPCPEDCTDNIDNDGDGLIDCDDPDCQAVGQPRPQDDSYQACPGADYMDQVSLNDDNLQNPNFSIVTAPTRGTVSIDYQGIFVYSANNFYCGLDSFRYEVCNQTTGCCDIANVYLTVGDNVPPVLQNVPADITIGCDEEIPEIPALVYGVDGCPGIFVSFEEESTAQLGNACDNYTITRIWQATDLCGNTVTGTQVITVQDEIAPEIFRVYTLANGEKMAGGISARTTTNWKYIEFPFNFSDVPMVFPQVVTENEVDAVTVRIRNVSEEGFELKLQEEENADDVHAFEEVAWLAIEPGDLTGAINMQSGVITNVTSGNTNIGFTNAFTGLPAFLAAMQTTEEDDPAAIRFNGLSTSDVNIFIQEEESFDAELIHGQEEVAYIAIDPGTLTDEDGTYVAETGSLNLDHNWTTVNLGRDFNKPVVVFGGVEAGNDPAVPRVRNVTSNSFEVRIQEWDYLNGDHPSDKVSYIVMEGSIPSVPEYFCDQGQVELIPEINLFAVDNCDRQLAFIYTDSSQYTSLGLRIYRKWTAVDDCGNSTDVLRTDTCGLAGVKVKVNLHGSTVNNFGATIMRDDLRASGKIPLEEPYSGFGGFTHYGNGGGEVVSQDILDLTGQNAIVDWVFIEIRDASDNAEIIATCSGLLERDGDVVTPEGDSVMFFPTLGEGNYFISIRHRNHLGMITEFVEYLSTADPVAVDFGDKYYSILGDLEASNFNEQGRRALWVGDVDGDGRVIFQGPNNDIFQIFSHILSHSDNEEHLANYISEGYLKEDLNMDGKAIFQGPNNDRTVMIYNTVLAHPGNSSFLANYIVNEILP